MGKHVVIDLEMCRVAKEMKREYRAKHEIIQIGAVLLDEDMVVTDRISILVKPEFGWIDPFIEKLTGISQSQVNDAPMLAYTMRQFIEWLPKEELVAVSWSMNDKDQFEKEFKAKALSFSEMEQLFDGWIDCQETFTKKVHAGCSYSLTDAMIATDIEGEGRAHDGLADAYNTALLFAKMETEEELVLNPYYAVACREKKEDTLSVSLGELFKGLDLSFATA
jgi:ERI1 exoribonuclease 2